MFAAFFQNVWTMLAGLIGLIAFGAGVAAVFPGLVNNNQSGAFKWFLGSLVVFIVVGTQAGIFVDLAGEVGGWFGGGGG